MCGETTPSADKPLPPLHRRGIEQTLKLRQIPLLRRGGGETDGVVLRKVSNRSVIQKIYKRGKI
jgi:hypothetical protein